MKKTTLHTTVCFVALCAAGTLWAQKPKGNFTAKFEDGTVIEYDLIRNQPDELFTKQISAMGTASEIGQSGELAFVGIVPARFQYSASLRYGLLNGFGGISVGGMWYFNSSEKPIQQSCSVRSISSGNTTTKYVVKVDASKGRYLGVHGDFGFARMGFGENGAVTYTYESGNYNLEKVSYGEVAVGLGYTSMKGVQVKVKETQGGYIGGSRMFNAVADLVFYPAMSVTATGTDSLGLAHPLAPEDISSGAVGFRVYTQAYTTFLYHKKKGAPNGCLGFTWRLGVVKAPYISSSFISIMDGKMAPLFGLGFFYTFY